MKIDAEKLHVIIHDIVNLGFVVHDIGQQLTIETKRIENLKTVLKTLEIDLTNLRQDILVSVEDIEEKQTDSKNKNEMENNK